MPDKSRKPLYGENGEVIGEVRVSDVIIDGRFVVECPGPRGHCYLIHPDELRQPDPPECPVCNKQECERKDA